MILLVTHAQPTIDRYGGLVGRLVQPRHVDGVDRTSAGGFVWAADNDCYQGLDAAAFGKMLVKIGGLPGCRFVTVPDVVADHDATLALWHEWVDVVGAFGPPAFVIQDGCTVYDVPWRDVGAIFVGGSTEYKLGAEAARIVVEAKRRGLWVHFGRVNSQMRMRYCASVGADSCDGTSYVMFERTHMRKGARAAAAPPQGRLVL